MRRLKSALSLRSPLFIVLYMLLFAAGGYVIVRSFAAPPATPSVYLTPSTQTLPASTTFTVALRESSGSTTVNAVQANLSYPVGLLDFVSIDGTTGAFTIAAEETGAAGVIRIARGNTTPVSGDNLIANITFKTKTTNGAAAVNFTSGTSLLNSTTNVDILGSLSATFGGSYTVDVTPPTVSISAPANGSTISAGSTATITAIASDNTAVSNVVILVDGATKATLVTSPYNYSWSTSGVSLGSHTIQARASDAYGNTTTSATTTVTVADITAPTTSITSPANGATLTGTSTVTASAADNTGGTGMNRVEFFVDSVLKSTDTTSPYTYSLNSTLFTDGAHSLTVKAYDNATPVNVATSAAISVTVDNSDHTAPTAPGNLTASARTLTSVTLSWTASSDNIGVTGYRVRLGSTDIATVSGTTLGYVASGLANGTSYTFTVTALDAAGNASTGATLSTSTLQLISGDFNGDGAVTITDLSLLLSSWGTNNVTIDVSHNGVVDIFDFSIMLSHWGQVSP